MISSKASTSRRRLQRNTPFRCLRRQFRCTLPWYIEQPRGPVPQGDCASLGLHGRASQQGYGCMEVCSVTFFFRFCVNSFPIYLSMQLYYRVWTMGPTPAGKRLTILTLFTVMTNRSLRSTVSPATRACTTILMGMVFNPW